MPRTQPDQAVHDRLSRLAARRGLDVERTAMPGCWRLVMADGAVLADETGATVFMSARAEEIILKFAGRSRARLIG